MTTTITLAGIALIAAGCEGAPNALDPRGPAAARVADLWWIMLGISSAVFILVVVLLVMAIAARPSGTGPEAPPNARRNNLLIVGGGIVIPALVIPVLLVLTFAAMAAMPPQDPDAELRIQVTGHKFWWHVVYPDEGVITANEIRIPTGQPVLFEVFTADVIHSFWVPQLGGKIDMIPGQDNFITLQADEPGVYRGICAEFCGIQHTHMHFHLIAEPPEDFAAWLEAQRQPAAEPQEPLAQQGREVFLRSACAACHTARGTPAAGDAGPDLTHLMSREWIAAGMIRNTTPNLSAFVRNPQAVKPGNLMPPTGMSPEEFDALIAYLETLE